MSNMEKSEIKEYKGYRYITIKMLFGYHHVCGYVEIPRGHYLFGKSYYEPIPELEPYNKRVLEGYPGKRGPMAIFGYALNQEKPPLPAEMFFNVHGSLTFGDRLMPRGESAPIFEWAMGFDTAHVDDDETTQTHEFCERECRLFIDQLVAIDKAMNDNTLPSQRKQEEEREREEYEEYLAIRRRQERRREEEQAEKDYWLQRMRNMKLKAQDDNNG